jgi:nicotinate-nucleotide adenylyltransferase
MEFFRRTGVRPHRLGILPGAFNPITIAHLALAQSALELVDEVLFVLPRVFPHKGYEGATFEQRLEMLGTALADEPRYSVGASGRGLFVEIAEECRLSYGSDVRLTFLCGRDAAERIVSWDYGRPGAIAGMLEKFDLLVSARAGEYDPPAELACSIAPLPIEESFDRISATEVRQRIAQGQPWEYLVPAAIAPLIRSRNYYLSMPSDSPTGM